MDIFTFCRVQYVEDGKRKALAANTCHLDVPSNVAEDVKARGHAREATVGEIAEAEALAGRNKPAKTPKADKAAAEKAAAEKAAAEKAAAEKAAAEKAAAEKAAAEKAAAEKAAAEKAAADKASLV